MTKNQKMLLGLGAVAVVGYLVYQNNKPKGFAGEKMNASGRIFGKSVLLDNKCTGADGGKGSTPASAAGLCCRSSESQIITDAQGNKKTVFKCCRSPFNWAEGTLNGACSGGAGAASRMGAAY